ncbi:unnamed protein product [Didymodactylos carnosus]|uniref:uracil phosphoribosyltransferase n=1 Tax=Didymodactylos carnosus TaxID=1234261 RepID=A0A814S7Q6_9BILA|nr:unnamed protein product [Didymodactylos carnosus]CAF3907938.1 unnamed protein product [Didymodactylos carnosus]
MWSSNTNMNGGIKDSDKLLKLKYPTLSIQSLSNYLLALHTKLRDQSTNTQEFVKYSNKLVHSLLEYTLSILPADYYDIKTIQTPCNVPFQGCSLISSISYNNNNTDNTMNSQLNLCGISIVRAGESMEFGLRSLIPDIPIGKILIQRDEFTQNKQAKLFYTKLPMNITQAKQIFLMDPMLATGGSCILAIKTLIKLGVTIQQITFINLIACPEGLQRVYAKYPQLKIVTSFVDQGLNEHCYILPGIGDYGDRYFGTVTP